MEGDAGRGTRDEIANGSRPWSHAPAPVCRLADIPPDGLLAATLADGTPVCLVRHEAQVWALHDRCTHADFSLSSGELLPDGSVQCLWHGARFDCRSGAVRQGPATDDVTTFRVRVDGESVYVEGGSRARESGIGSEQSNDRQ